MKLKDKIKKILKYAIVPITMATAFVSMLCVDTYAYTTNQESYTMTKETYNNNTYYKLDRTDYNNWTNYVYFMINYTTTSTGNYTFSLYRCAENYGNIAYSSQSVNINANVGGTIRTYIWQLSASDLNNTYYFRVQTSANNFQVVNYDFCQSYEMTLTPYYDTYVSNLENQLDELQNDYDILQGQYDTLSDNYDTLFNEYGNYTSLIPFNKDNVSSVSVKVNNVAQEYQDDYMTQYNQTSISWNTRDFDYFNNLNTSGLNDIEFTYVFKNNYYSSNLRANIDLVHSYEDEILFNFYRDNNNVYNFSCVPESDSQLEDFYEITNFEFNSIVVHFIIDYRTLQNNRTQTLYNSNNFNDGYNIGYQVAQQRYNDELISEKAKSKQEGLNQGYEQGYQVGASQSNSLYGLVIAVIDAPINIFKSIFNFDILGINIVGVTFGIVTLLVIVWLIKKLI